jgi:hypothetical protein
MSPLSAFLAMLVALPVVLLLAWCEYRCDEYRSRETWPVDRVPPGVPEQTTWQAEEIEA